MTAPPDAPNPKIDELFARFSQRPTDVSVFEELERELRAAGRHLHLAGAYEVRLQSLSDPAQRSTLLLTLAEILDVDLRAPRAALKRLKEARALTPQHPDVLRRLRQLLVRQGDGMAALQIAEDEERLELPPKERASLLAETAQLWTLLGEENQVRSRLQEALRLDPDCSVAQYELELLDQAAVPEAEADANAKADADAADDAHAAEEGVSPPPGNSEVASGSGGHVPPMPPAAESLEVASSPEGHAAPGSQSAGSDHPESENPEFASATDEPWELPDVDPFGDGAAVDAGGSEASPEGTRFAPDAAPARSAVVLEAYPGEDPSEALTQPDPDLPDPSELADLPAVEPAPRSRSRKRTRTSRGAARADAAPPPDTPATSGSDSTPSESGRSRSKKSAPSQAVAPEPSDAGTVLDSEPSAQESEPIDVHALELQADACAQSGDLAGWASALEQLDAAQGASYERALQLTELYELAGNAERAPEPLERWFADHGDEPAGLSALDRCYQRLERHADRSDVLRRHFEVKRSASEGARVASALGALLRTQLRDAAGAERAFRDALSCAPEDESALEALAGLLLDAGRHEEWVELLAENAGLLGSGELAAVRCCRAAEHARSQGQFTRARELWIEALERAPEHGDAIAGLRALEAETGDQEARRAACEAELRNDADGDRHEPLLRELFEIARDGGDPAAAREAARRWAECDPSIEPLRALAKLARDAGESEHERAALESLEPQLEDSAERARCRTRLGELAEAQAGPLSRPNALRWYREALELDPRGPARERLIALWREEGRVAEIAGLLERELETGITQDGTATRLELAELWSDANAFDRAAAVLLPWFLRDPSQLAVADRLEEILERDDDLETRVSVLDQRIQAAANPAERLGPALRLARIYLDRLARPAEAVSLLRECVDESPDSEAAALYERALVASGSVPDQIAWNRRQIESSEDAHERLALWLRVAALHESQAELASAIECLEHAEDLELRDATELTARPLLSLLCEVGDGEARLERLDALGHAARTARARAAFVLERTRILLDLDRTEAAMQELDRLPRAVALKPAEWRLVCDLTRRAGDGPRLRHALETLIEVSPDSPERRALRLQLADLYLGDDESIRDPERGEALLYELLDDTELHQAAAERLGELLIQTGRRRARAELLARRLREPEIGQSVRRVLTAQLAELCLQLGDAAQARQVLEAERDRGGSDADLDRLLCNALGMLGEHTAQDDLYRERVLTEAGAERSRWLRRWLTAHEHAEAPAEARLEVIERWLAFVGSDPELEQRRIGLLRETGRLEPLAHALEDQLATDARLTPGRQSAIIRELLRTYEGPLAAPKRALRLCERELERHPELREEAVRLAARVGDYDRERTHLRALLEAHSSQDPRVPAWNRRLALMLVEQGRSDEARDALRRALKDFPLDRDLLRALDPIERHSLQPARLLELQEQRYPLESGPSRLQLVREAFTLAEQLCDAMNALRWIRRWRLEENPPLDTLKRWVSLERAVGDPAGLHEALGVLAEATPDAEGRAARIAERATLYEERGECQLAREDYLTAAELAPRHSIPWLKKLADLAERRGENEDLLAVLASIMKHPEASSEDRSQAMLRRVAKLCSQPDQRARAAAELSEQLAADPTSSRGSRIERLRQLAELYDALGETRSWCETAEQLVPILEPEDSERWRRELARRWECLAAREATIGLWRSVLDSQPRDEEALEALVRLLDRPGEEEQRARVLETWAAVRSDASTAHSDHSESADPVSGSGPSRARERASGADLWMEAARLRWRQLGDAEGALRAVDHALEIDPLAFSPHALRAEVCAALQQPEGEEESLRVMLEAEPDSESAAPRWLRVVELIHQRSGSSEELRNALERVCRATREGDPLRVQVRHWLSHLGCWDDVARLLREEIEHGDEHALEALRELARVEWEELSRAEQACGAFEQLSARGALAPEDEDRWAQALEALELAPDSLPHRERALAGLGQRARGQDWFELASLLAEEDPNDPERMRQACARALELDKEHTPALRMSVELDQSLGRLEDERSGRLLLAEREADPGDAARQLARASQLSLDLNDPALAAEIAERALDRDANNVEALWCAGASADQRQDLAAAERAYSRLCKLVTDPVHDALRAARSAARAARELGRAAAANHYLDLALTLEPHSPEVLLDVLDLSRELGHHERVRHALETLLELGKASDSECFEWRLLLASCCLELGDLEAAATSLEAAQQQATLPPADQERLIDTLEILGETDRVLRQLDALDPGIASPEETCLRAARAEVAADRFEAAETRLESALEEDPRRASLWMERGALIARRDGPGAALAAYDAIEAIEFDAEQTAALAWQAQRWARECGDVERATHEAARTLDAKPDHGEAARYLAERLRERARPEARDAASSKAEWGEVNSLAQALTPDIDRIQRAAASGAADAAVTAELYFSVGLAYAACCDWAPACEAYRSALDHNPEHESAREAFADLAVYQAETQREGALLQRDLLQERPTRPTSWQALLHASERHNRPRAVHSCHAVLVALGLESPPDAADATGGAVLVAPAPADAAVTMANEFLQSLGELELLPVHQDANARGVPEGAIGERLLRLTGGAFALPNTVIGRLLSQSAEDLEAALAEIPRLKRRRPRKAHRALSEGPTFDLDEWRIETLTQAAALELASNAAPLDTLLRSLVELWPATRKLRTEAPEQRLGPISACPPAGRLLARIAVAVGNSL